MRRRPIRRPHGLGARRPAAGAAALAVALAGLCGVPAGADDPAVAAGFDLTGVDAGLLAPFRPVRAPLTEGGRPKGYVDWSARRIVATGRARQAGRKPASALQARRAAEVIALRNVLAAAAGVRIGPSGRIGQLKSGRLDLRGHVKDFKVARTYRRVVGGTTYWIAEVHVPMFGVGEVSARLYDEQLMVHRELTAGRKRARWAAPAGAEALGGDLLVLDARGLGFRPSMYPMIVNEAGTILLDMKTAGKRAVIARGLCAYATTETAFEKLHSTAQPPGASAAPMWGGLRRVARGRLLLAQAGPAPAPPTTAPAASQPTPRPRQKARRRAVRAVRTGGKQKAVMVISNKDSAKLLADPKAAGLARQGRVLVVVDAAAGGMEGRRPRRPGPTDLAGAPR